MDSQKNQKCSNVTRKLVFSSEEVEKLLHAKQTHGQLFLFSRKSDYLIFRPLTVKESETLLELSPILSDVAIEDWIVTHAYVSGTLSAETITNYAGYMCAKNIAQKIMMLSNIQDEETYIRTLEMVRKKSTTVQHVVETIISKAFPSLGPEFIKNSTQIKQLKWLGVAEKITGESLAIGGRTARNTALRRFRPDAEVIGGEVAEVDLRPGKADIPDFDEVY